MLLLRHFKALLLLFYYESLLIFIVKCKTKTNPFVFIIGFKTLKFKFFILSDCDSPN